VDVPKTQKEATEALNDLETLWKDPDKDVGKQLNKGQPIFQRLSKAIKAGVLLEADLTRWEYLIDSFRSAAEEIEGGEGDVDEVDGDASKEEKKQLKEAKQKSKARIKNFWTLPRRSTKNVARMARTRSVCCWCKGTSRLPCWDTTCRRRTRGRDTPRARRPSTTPSWCLRLQPWRVPRR
jgi:hypothetical protein